MLRILHIMADPTVERTNNIFLDIVQALHDEGFDQCLVVDPRNEHFEIPVKFQIRVEWRALSSPFPFVRRKKLDALIAAERPDIIHAWRGKSCRMLKNGNQVPTIGWLDDYEDFRTISGCSHFVGVTKDVVGHLVSKGAAPDRVVCIPPHPVLGEAVSIDRALFETPMAAPVVLSLSPLEAQKGHETLLQALAKMSDTFLWLAGEGAEKKSLQKKVAKLGISHRVRFLGARADHGALLRAADVCALPSRCEVFSPVILESWAAGTPLVATKTVGASALVHNRESGLLVGLDDADQLAQALSQTLQDEGLRRAVISGGYASYSRHYTRKNAIERIVGFYKTVAQK